MSILAKKHKAEKGVRVAAPDLRKAEQLELYALLLSDSNIVSGFKNKDLRGKSKEILKLQK